MKCGVHVILPTRSTSATMDWDPYWNAKAWMEGAVGCTAQGLSEVGAKLQLSIHKVSVQLAALHHKVGGQIQHSQGQCSACAQQGFAATGMGSCSLEASNKAGCFTAVPHS